MDAANIQFFYSFFYFCLTTTFYLITMIDFSQIHRRSIGYDLFREYVRLLHNYYYYKQYKVVHAERIPPQGTPTLIISNHQNGLNDALGLLFSMDRRQPIFLARSDIFKRNFVAKMLRSLRIMPIFRVRDGVSNLSKNDIIAIKACELINSGRTMAIYPEAGHENKRHLDQFRKGFARLVFQAAARQNFEHDIFIVPSGHHYDNYFEPRGRLLISYGKPISLKPYFKLYQENQQQALRKIASDMMQEVRKYMLDISNLECYPEYDFIRNTYGREFSQKFNLKFADIEDRLKSDQLLINDLESCRHHNDPHFKDIIESARTYMKNLAQYKIRDWVIRKHPAPFQTIGICSFLLLGLPFFFIGFLLNAPLYFAPHPIKKKVSDEMLHASFILGLTAVVTFPIWTLICVVTISRICHSIPIGLSMIVLIPLSGVIAWEYRTAFRKFLGLSRFYLLNKNKRDELFEQKNHLYTLLRQISSSGTTN